MIHSGIFKTQINEWGDIPKQLFNEAILEKHHDGWKKRIVSFLRKKENKNPQ